MVDFVNTIFFFFHGLNNVVCSIEIDVVRFGNWSVIDRHFFSINVSFPSEEDNFSSFLFRFEPDSNAGRKEEQGEEFDTINEHEEDKVEEEEADKAETKGEEHTGKAEDKDEVEEEEKNVDRDGEDDSDEDNDDKDSDDVEDAGEEDDDKDNDDENDVEDKTDEVDTTE